MPRWNGEMVNRRAADLRPDLVDLLIDLYCDWRTACAEVWAAYERLNSASASERAVAFAAYTAALDREQSACESYAAHIHMVETRLAGSRVVRVPPQLIESNRDA